MKKSINLNQTHRNHVLITALAIIVFSAEMMAFADYPSWWHDRGVVDTNAVSTNDYAAVNQGQLKNMASAAYDEFGNTLTNADLTVISNMVQGFSVSNNYAAVNLGQMKHTARPFYDVLWNNDLTNAWPVGMTSGPYPWSGTTNTGDYALVNLGQLKYVYSFDPSLITNTPPSQGFIDSDGDGMPDEWEILNELNPTNSADAWIAQNEDGMPSLIKFVSENDPKYHDIGMETWIHVDTNDVEGIQGAINWALANAQSNTMPVVVVEPGLYTGPNNRNLTITNNLALLGQPGTMIDCEGTGGGTNRAFYAVGGDWIVIDGFDVVNADHADGAGIYAETGIGNLVAGNIKFADCTSPDYGVVWVDDTQGNAYLNGLSFSNCIMSYAMTEIWVAGNVRIENIVIENCHLNDALMCLWEASDTLYTNLTISTCYDNEMLFDMWDSAITLDYLKILNSSSYDTAIYAYTDELMCKNVTVSNVTSGISYGDMFVLEGGGNGIAEIESSSIFSSVSDSGFTVGYGWQNITFSNVVINGSSFDHYAINAWCDDIFTMTDCEISDSFSGSDLISPYGSLVELASSQFKRNWCWSVASFYNGDISLNRVEIDRNDCSTVFSYEVPLSMTNTLVSGCQTDTGIFYAYGSGELSAVHSTFVGCDSLEYAGGNFGDTPAAFNNSIIMRNTGAETVLLTNAASVVVNNSCVDSDWTGSGTNNTDFLHGIAKNGRLVASHSEAIDYGDVVLVDGADIDRELRDAAPDMGADEWGDADGDGLVDWWELAEYGDLSSISNSPPAPDGDGRMTLYHKSILGLDAYDSDYDNDGLADFDEDAVFNLSGIGTDPFSADSDGDGFGDYDEYHSGMNPLLAAVPGSADWENDADGDGLSNGFELENLLNPFRREDWDMDGLWDDLEFLLNADPYDSDTDDDGFSDGEEYVWGYSSPVTNEGYFYADNDSDGLPGWQEFQYGTNPTNSDTDVDGSTDGEEVEWGSIPTNANSYLVSVQGNIQSDDLLEGPFKLFMTSSNQIRNCTFTNETISVTNLPNLNQYEMLLFRDINHNGEYDIWEESGVTNLVLVNTITDVNIVLSHPDRDGDDLPDWWEYTRCNGDVDPSADADYDGVNNMTEYVNGLNPLNPDTDHDGAADGLEINAGTDPEDSGSAPASVCGVVDNASGQQGHIHVLAVETDDDWTSTGSIRLQEEGSYRISGLTPSVAYYIRAFVDVNENETWDVGESRADSSSSPVVAAGEAHGVNILITHPASDVDLDGDGMSDSDEILFGRDREAYGHSEDPLNESNLRIYQPNE